MEKTDDEEIENYLQQEVEREKKLSEEIKLLNEALEKGEKQMPDLSPMHIRIRPRPRKFEEEVDSTTYPMFAGLEEGITRIFRKDYCRIKEKRKQLWLELQAFRSGVDVLEPYWKLKRNLTMESPEERLKELEWAEEFMCPGMDARATLFLNGFGKFYPKHIQEEVMKSLTPEEIKSAEAYQRDSREYMEKLRPRFKVEGWRRLFDFSECAKEQTGIPKAVELIRVKESEIQFSSSSSISTTSSSFS